MDAKEYRVEGHGTELLMIGGVTTALSPYRPSSLLTRQGAWSTIQSLVAGRKYHTLKVYKGGTLVYRAYRNVDGSYVDSTPRVGRWAPDAPGAVA